MDSRKYRELARALQQELSTDLPSQKLIANAAKAILVGSLSEMGACPNELDALLMQINRCVASGRGTPTNLQLGFDVGGN